MKIVILSPKSEFPKRLQRKIEMLGKVVWLSSRKEVPLKDLKKLVQGANIIAIDPDVLGGFEKARYRLSELIKTVSTLKGLALATTSTEYVDLEYCRRREVEVLNIPGYATEAVAEQTMGVIIGLAKRIFLSDRRTQKQSFKLEMGFELQGKTLGIIGLGRIGARTAQLARCFGMQVVAYNRTPKTLPGIKMLPLDRVLRLADVLSLHLTANKATEQFISKAELDKVKRGVIIVNLASRELVDEKAMANALKVKKVDSYAYEGDDLKNGPLAGLENAFGFKIFSWYTKEALERATEIWTDNIVKLAKQH